VGFGFVVFEPPMEKALNFEVLFELKTQNDFL